MALATQCPHCHTTFRVAHDQLKLRAGLVRCGACKQIFNGIENLLRPEELQQSGRPTSPPTPTPLPAVAPPASSLDASPLAIPEDREPGKTPQDADAADAPDGVPPDASAHASTQSGVADIASADSTPHTEDAPANRDNPLLRMTLMDFAHEHRGATPLVDGAGPPRATEDDGIERAIDDLEQKPWRREDEAQAQDGEADPLDRIESADYEEPSFVKQGRRRQRIGRALRILMVLGSIVLLLSLLAQSAYVFRDRIAASFPQTKPMLIQACAHLGCQVGLPAQIESVSIESSELQTLQANSNAFALTVLLRNHGATEQAWPSIELTLNDAGEKPILRKVFVPKEYLAAPADPKKGFPPRSEQPVKLFFELADVKASGYRVYLFYP